MSSQKRNSREVKRSNWKTKERKTFIIIIIFRVTNGLGFWRETTRERDERDEHYSEDDDEEEK